MLNQCINGDCTGDEKNATGIDNYPPQHRSELGPKWYQEKPTRRGYTTAKSLNYRLYLSCYTVKLHGQILPSYK